MRFADDQAMMSSEVGLQVIMNKLSHVVELHEMMTNERGNNRKRHKRTPIALAKAAVNKRKVVLSKNLNLDFEKKLVNTLVWKVLSNGLETWDAETRWYRKAGKLPNVVLEENGESQPHGQIR